MDTANQVPLDGPEEQPPARIRRPTLSQKATRPPVRPPWRVFKAYFVTLVVLSSYLWIRFLARYSTEMTTSHRLQKAHLRNARRIYRTIIELQGLYIKVGQLLSIMSNFMPGEFRDELAGLQDRVPARAYEAIERRIIDEFSGRGPDKLFETFDTDPIASASIGQVHMATLPGGRRVAVKVQYPDIERIVRADLQTLGKIFRFVQRFVAYKGLDAIYQEIREIVIQELDFTAEAQNGERVSAAFAGREDVAFPQVVRELTTPRVLTTEYIEGIKVNDIVGLERLGIDRGRLARLVIESYCQQIFNQGLYHADPHPGNILVQAGEGEGDPKITFIDFGAVAEVSPQMQQGLVQLIQGAFNRDTQKIVGAFREMGFIAYSSDPEIYDRVIEYFHERFQKEIKIDSFNLKDIKIDPQQGFKDLADLRKMDISLADITNTFHVPKEWIMLERTILMLMGLCTELDPQLNPMDAIRPHIESFVLGEDGDWSKFVLDAGRELALSAVALPGDIRKLSNKMNSGQLQVRLAGPDNVSVFYALGHQIIFTALGVTSVFFAYEFYERGLADWAQGCTIAASVFGALLLRSMWKTGRLLRRHRRRF